MFYKIAHAILRVIWLVLYRLKVTGLSNVPPGAAILCGNHSSLADPVILAIALKPEDQPRFMAKKELFSFRPFAFLITALGAFPVDRGKADLGAVKKSLDILRCGKKLMVLPQGTRVHEGEAAEIKNGAAMLASRSGAPLVPVHIGEGRKPIFNRTRVDFGSPIDFVYEGRKPTPEEYKKVMDEVMDKVTELGKQ